MLYVFPNERYLPGEARGDSDTPTKKTQREALRNQGFFLLGDVAG